MSKQILRELCLYITDGEHGSVERDMRGTHYLLSAKNLLNGKVVHVSDERLISDRDFLRIRARTRLDVDDVVISTTGTIGNLAVIRNCDSFEFNRDVGILKCNKEVLLPDFLYYTLLSLPIQKKLLLISKGCTQKHLYIDDLATLEVEVPSLATQQSIISVLKSIDDKIDINNSICEELESMARTLYDYWFVQFDFPDENGRPYRRSGGEMVWCQELGREIPKGWRCGNFADLIADIRTGLNPRQNFTFSEGGIRYLTVKNLTQAGYIDYSGCDMIDETARAIVHRRSDIRVGDVLFASIAPLGRCYLIVNPPTDWDINESVFSLRPRCESCTPEYLYLTLKSDIFVAGSTNSSTGSIFKGIRINTLLDMLTAVPPLEIMKAFSCEVSKIIKKQHSLFDEIAQLSNTRDWLLPMLMNGQVFVE